MKPFHIQIPRAGHSHIPGTDGILACIVPADSKRGCRRAVLRSVVRRGRLFLGIVAATAAVLQVCAAQAEPLRTQVLSLTAGWNAIHLQVEPEPYEPEALFAGTPIDVVARYLTTVSSLQFISDPSDEPWKQPGWSVWYAPHRSDGFLSSLFAIRGGRTYLVHSESAFDWRVSGRVIPPRVAWKVNAYNLAGFAVDHHSPPTFGTFFSGTSGRIGGRILRLENERWKLVQDPGSTRMRDGEACWIYCEGATDYQGSLEVTTSSGSLRLRPGATRRVLIRNRSPLPVTIALESMAAGGDPLPLRLGLLELSTLTSSYPPLPERLELHFEPGAVQALDLREGGGGEGSSLLLRFSSSDGALVWMPASVVPGL